MWLSRLPDPGKLTSNEAPLYRENVLFTEKIDRHYTYPEHITSLGVITVLQGDGHFGINGKYEQLHRERFLVVNSNSRLSIDIHGNTNPALLYFRAQLPGIIAASLYKTADQLLDDPTCDCAVDFGILERIHPMNERLKNKLMLLIELGGGSSSFAALKADIIVRSILEEMTMNNIIAHKESLNIQVKKRSTRIELYKRLYQAKEWIDSHFDHPLTLDMMAQIACMNSQHFLRSFKQLFLYTPHQYLIDVRLENAKRMLLSTNETIQAICRNTGLESLSSFSWLFKQKFGLSPSNFRSNK